MKVRKKTKKRVLILLAILVVLGCAVTGLYFFRQNQLDERAVKNLTIGRAAREKGEISKGITHYRRYLTRFEDDPDPVALYEFAQMLADYERSGETELKLAIASLSRALDIDRSLPDAPRLLMNLYLRAGYYNEALGLAKDFLGEESSTTYVVGEDEDQFDREALWVKAMSLARLGETAQARLITEARTKIRTSEPKWHFLHLELLVAAESTPDVMVNWAEGASMGREDEPEFALLLCTAYLMEGNSVEARDRAWEVLKPFAKAPKGEPLEDEGMTYRLIQFVDALGKQQDSMALLEKSWEKFQNVSFLYELVRRRWQRGEHELVVALTDDFNPGKQAAAISVLGHRALSLRSLDRQEDLAKCRDAIDQFGASQLARAWSNFLAAVFSEDQATWAREVIDASLQALTIAPGASIFHFYLASAYEAVGESDLAIRSYWDATLTSKHWTAPALLAARMLAVRGFVVAAQKVVQVAYDRSDRDPDDPDPAIVETELLVKGRAFQGLDDASKADFINDLDEGAESRVESLPLRAHTRALDGEPEKANQLILDQLASGEEISPRIMLGICWVAKVHELEVLAECLARFERDHGDTPEYISFAAGNLLREGKAEEGRQLIQDARERADAAELKAWELVLAQFLSRIESEDAESAWVALGDKYPTDIAVQIAVASDNSAWGDAVFIGRTVERLKELTGETGLRWRIAKARTLLRPESTEREVTEAVALLADVLAIADYRFELRLLLALGLNRIGEVDQAVENVNILVERERQSGNLNPRLRLLQANLLARKQDYPAARKVLEPLLADDRLTAEKSDAAILAGQLGLYAEAENAFAGMEDNSRPMKLFRAEMLIKLNRIETVGEQTGAEELINELLEEPDLASVLLAIQFYAGQGRREEAMRLAGELGKFDVDPARQALVNAELLRSEGSWKEAEAAYRQTGGAGIDAGRARLRLLSLLASLGRAEDLVAAIEEFKADEAGKADVAHLSGHLDLVRYSAEQSGLRGLLMAWIEIPPVQDEINNLVYSTREFSEGRLSSSEYSAKLQAAADENVQVWPIQNLAVRTLTRMGESRESLRIARRAHLKFGTLDEASQLLAEALLAAGEYAEAQDVVEGWITRTTSRKREAEFTRARIKFALGLYKGAADLLEPYAIVENAKDPFTAAAIRGRARALIRDDQVLAARDLLRPLWQEDPRWVLAALDLAVSDVQELEQAKGLLDEVLAGTPVKGATVQLAAARAWVQLSDRARQDGEAILAEECKATAEALFKEITARRDLPAAQWMLVGMYQEAAGLFKAAQFSYTKAIKLDKKLNVAKNNLAVLLSREGKTADALGLALSVVEAEPNSPEFRDTLAMVYEAAGKINEAIAAIEEALRLDPVNPRWQIKLAELLLKIGRRDEARKRIEAVKLNIARGLVLQAEYRPMYEAVIKELE